MGVPGWIIGVVISAFFIIGGIIIEEFSQTEDDLIQRISDTAIIFGGIILAISVIIIGVGLVKTR